MKSPSRAVQNLREFIAVPSVNPMDRDDIPDSIAGETRYAEAVHSRLVSLGLDARLIGQGNRKSVIAEASVPGARDTVLVASHLDTVPVDGMEIDPFDPRIEDERVLGKSGDRRQQKETVQTGIGQADGR